MTNIYVQTQQNLNLITLKVLFKGKKKKDKSFRTTK